MGNRLTLGIATIGDLLLNNRISRNESDTSIENVE